MKLHKNSTLADRLKWLRAQSKLTLQGFADKIAFDKSYVSRLESGKSSNPSVDFIGRVAKAFGVSKSWLMEGQGEPGTHIVADDSAALPDNLVERMEEVLSCVEVVRLLAVELPPLKFMQIMQDLPKNASLSVAARAFWMRVFLRAFASNPGNGVPMVVEQILKHHLKNKKG